MRDEIVVIEDDEDIQELLRYNLGKAGYRVTCFSRGEEGLREIRDKPPDLLLLDLMLPGIDGLDVCKSLKADAQTSRLPIVMISARGEEYDVVIGLELGADDYIVKPFSPRVLLARVKAVLRRRAAADSEDEQVIRRGQLLVDISRHIVQIGASRVDLTPTEFGILCVLSRKSGWVFTRHQIVDAVRGEDYAVTERSVDVQIVGLRKKLKEAAGCIETVRGIGYRFSDSAA